MGESLWSRAQEVQPVDDAGDDPLHPRLEMFRREPPNLSIVCRVWTPCMRARFRCNDGEGIPVGHEGEMGPVTATPGVVHTAAHTPRAALVTGTGEESPPVRPNELPASGGFVIRSAGWSARLAPARLAPASNSMPLTATRLNTSFTRLPSQRPRISNHVNLDLGVGP